MTVTINGSGTIGGISVGGLNDNIITKNEMATGGAWGPAGTVLQVVQGTYSTPVSTSSTSYVSTNVTASITPTSSTSKILIIANLTMYCSGNSIEAAITIGKNGSDLTSGSGFADMYTGSSDIIGQTPAVYLDSPATTSSTSYTIYMKRTQGASPIQANFRGTTSSIILMEIAA